MIKYLCNLSHHHKMESDFNIEGRKSSQLVKIVFFILYSVWSNACVWHGALMSNMYISDKMRAAVGGQKLTIQEAVEKFVFEDEVIEEIDAYSWPYNSECAF